MKLLRSSAMRGAHTFRSTGLIVAAGLSLSIIGYAQTPAITPAAVITTFAGDGSATFNGDGGLAINSELGRVSDVAVDKAGNVYIADLENNRIRKVDTNGIISTVAGTGVAGFSGDGGPATAAQLRNSTGIAVDSLGSLYIADGGNARIRKVDGNSGVISTIAGTGSSGFSGDGGPATSAKISGPQYVALDSAGNIFFSDANNYVVRKIGTDGTIKTIAGIGGRATEIGDNIPATQATLNYTYMVKFDAIGNLYISEGNRLRKVDTNGIISTVAGSVSNGNTGDGGLAKNATLNHPQGGVIDGAGNIYLSDTNNSRVRKIDTGGFISAFAGTGAGSFGGDGGLARSAYIQYPEGLALDAAGNLYIADLYNHRVRMVASTTPSFPSTAVGQTSSPQTAYLQINQSLKISNIQFPAAEGNMQEFNVGATTSCPLNTTLSINTICAVSITFSPKYSGNRSTPLTLQTNYAQPNFTFATVGAGIAPQVAIVPGTISAVVSSVSSTANPYTVGIARSTTGDMYIATYDNLIKKLSSTGVTTIYAGTGAQCPNQTSGTSPCGDGGLATSATFRQAYNVALDSSGNLYISDAGIQRVRKVDANGKITTIAGNGSACGSPTAGCGDSGYAISANLNSPSGIAVDSKGNLFIADSSNNRVRKVDTNGIITTVAGTGIAGSIGDNGQATGASLNQPTSVGVDAEGNIYIGESNGWLVRKVSGVTGVITTVAGIGNNGGSFAIPASGIPASQATVVPSDLALDSAGNIYIAEGQLNRISRVDGATGIIRPIAGTLTSGNAGDGGPATSATLNQPAKVALDSYGNLYISDFANNRIRQVSIGGANVTFPDTAIGQLSSSRTAVVSNIGNSNLSITDTATGTLDFVVDSAGNCKGLATLGSGSTCDLMLDFQPQQIGSRSDNVTISDDVLNTPGSTQQVALSGTGLQVPTTISLVIDTADTIAFGTAVKLTATVTPYSSGAVVAGGTIQFFDGSVSLGAPATVSSIGESSITISTFAVAATPHNLTAVYSGDTNFKTSTSPVLGLTVHAAPISVSLSSSDNPSEYGQVVTFRSTVPTPATGTIQFVDGGVNLGSPVAINGAGVATISLNTLTVGTHPITAVYSGDRSHAPANSDVLNQQVIPAFLTVTANNFTRIYDTSNGTPGYTVTGFIGSDTEQSSVSGAPALSITATAASPVGDYTITAALGTLASSNYSFKYVNGTLTITKATPGIGGVTSISLASSVNPSTWGENVTLTATFPSNATGQVTFIDGTVVLGTAIILNEKALFSTTQFSIATHPVTAVYAGDMNYNGATSAVLDQVVNKATLDIVANDAERAFGQPNPSFTTTIGGFVNGDTSVVISGTPQVTTLATVNSPVGIYPILPAQGTLAAANYNFVFIAGNLQVMQTAGTETLTASTITTAAGTPVSFTATVPMGATGMVTFLDGSTVLGTVPLNGTAALLTTSTLGVGTHSIEAVYSGDANFTTASATLSVSVVVAADFNVTSNTPRQLIPPGASATYNIIISSVNAPFTNVVALTASNLPPGATYTFTPSSVTPGGAGATSSFTVAVPNQTAAKSRMKGSSSILLAALLLPWMWVKRLRSPRLLLWLLLSFGTLATLMGCGVGGYFSQSEQTYTITVTGTSGSLVRSTTVTLTVE